MTTAAEAVTQFVGDVGIAHAIIHGPATGPSSIVATEGGNVKTLARAIAEGGATAAEIAALRTALQSLSTTDLADWSAATANFLTEADIPVLPLAAIKFACSNLTTALTTGTNKGYERASFAFSCSSVRASLLVASTSGNVVVDILCNGVSILSTKITIEANENTSVSATNQPVLTVTEFNDDDEFTASITSAGTGAKGLIVAMIGAAV